MIGHHHIAARVFCRFHKAVFVRNDDLKACIWWYAHSPFYCSRSACAGPLGSGSLGAPGVELDKVPEWEFDEGAAQVRVAALCQYMLPPCVVSASHSGHKVSACIPYALRVFEA